MLLKIPEELKTNIKVELFFNQLVKSLTSNPRYIGDPNTEGSWKIEDDGTDLNIYRLESSVWVLKDTITS